MWPHGYGPISYKMCPLSLSFSLFFFPPFFIPLLSLPLYSLSLSLSQNQIGERWQNCKSFFEYWIIIFNTIVRTHGWLLTAGSHNDSIPVEVFSIDWICWFCFSFYNPVWQLIKFYYDNFWLIDWLCDVLHPSHNLHWIWSVSSNGFISAGAYTTII